MDNHIDLGCEFEEDADAQEIESSRNEWPSIRVTFGWGENYLEQARGPSGSLLSANSPRGDIRDYVQLPSRGYLTYEIDAWEFDHRFPRFVVQELFFVRVRDRRVSEPDALQMAAIQVGIPFRSAPQQHVSDVGSTVQAVFEAAPASVRAGFVEAITGATAQEPELDEALWGRGPSPGKLRTAALQALKDDFVARRELIDASLPAAEVAELLGTSAQAVRDFVMSGDLVGLADGNDWRIPMWQLKAGVEQGFLPGIAQLRRVFPGGIVSLSRWMVTPSVDLGEMTPADVLAAGRVEEVFAVAAVTTAAAW